MEFLNRSTISQPAVLAQKIARAGLMMGCTRQQLVAIMAAIGIDKGTAGKQFNDIKNQKGEK